MRTSSMLGRYSSAIRAACANERSCGSVRGATSNGRPYRDLKMPRQRVLSEMAFYEKVIKVKADVAANLINCFPSA